MNQKPINHYFKDKNLLDILYENISDIESLANCNSEMHEYYEFKSMKKNKHLTNLLHGTHLNRIQKSTVNKMLKPMNMNIIAPCGFGKSRCALIAAININQPTFILVPNMILMRTLLNEAEKLGMSNNLCVNSSVLFYSNDFRKKQRKYIDSIPLNQINSVIVMTIAQINKMKSRIENQLHDIVIIRDEAHKGVKLNINARTILISATYTYNDNITWCYKRREPIFNISYGFLTRKKLPNVIDQLCYNKRMKNPIIITDKSNMKNMHNLLPSGIIWKGNGVKTMERYDIDIDNCSIILPCNITEGISLYKSNCMIIDTEIKNLPMQLIGRMVRERNINNKFMIVCLDNDIMTKIKIRIACHCTIRQISNIELKDHDNINKIINYINDKKIKIDDLSDKDLIYLFCHSNITWGDVNTESNLGINKLINIGFIL